jgi:hypothetical protein
MEGAHVVDKPTGDRGREGSGGARLIMSADYPPHGASGRIDNPVPPLGPGQAWKRWSGSQRPTSAVSLQRPEIVIVIRAAKRRDREDSQIDQRRCGAERLTKDYDACSARRLQNESITRSMAGWLRFFSLI